MEAKEKAIELVDKFDLPSGLMSIERKQCALIAVDEIVDYLEKIMFPFPFKSYWAQVKEEIEKL
jgi:hypothetical protein